MNKIWIYSALLLPLIFSCSKEEIKVQARKKIEGEVEVVNGTDQQGLGDKTMKFLRRNGYNVVRVTQGEQNYDRTIIALRSPKWKGIDTLKKDLGTDNVILLENPQKMLDVTVFVGRDKKDLFQNE